MTADEIVRDIKRYKSYFKHSGGGVTFSGGEPMYQALFLLDVLDQCRESGINTAIDTSGYCDTETMLRAAQTAHYFLYDLKFSGSKKHENYSGVPNDLIIKLYQIGDAISIIIF